MPAASLCPSCFVLLVCFCSVCCLFDFVLLFLCLLLFYSLSFFLGGVRGGGGDLTTLDIYIGGCEQSL